MKIKPIRPIKLNVLKNCCEHTVFVGVAISRTCGVFCRAVVVLGRLRRSDRRGCVIAIRIFIFRMNQLERVYQIIQNLAERKWTALIDFLNPCCVIDTPSGGSAHLVH